MLRGFGVSFVAQLAIAGVFLAQSRAQAQAPSAQDPAIVFIAPAGLPEELNLALEDAVSAQVSLVGARLVFLTAADEDAGLEERMSQAEALANEHDAAGVFWIDARPSRRWFLYIMDRSGAHVVVRPLSAEGASMDAAIEAAAVIAGSASDALLKQQSIEARLAAPPPAAPPPPPEAALQLELGYSGTVFAPRVPWIHGLWFGAAWIWPSGPYLGVSYVWSPPVQIVDEVTFELTRYPIWVQGGVRLKPLPATFPGFTAAVELAVGVELRTRSSTNAIFQVESADRSTRVSYLTSVRLIGNYQLTSWLALVLRISPELTLNNFDYMKQPAEPGKAGLTYLSPYILRFTAQLGLAIVR